MIKAIFDGSSNAVMVSGLWQWDYGQVLSVTGLNLPAVIEMHFNNGTEKSIIFGETVSGVTFAGIPDKFLQSADQINVYVYVNDGDHGKTLRQIVMHVQARERPADYDPPNAQELMGRILEQIIECVTEAKGYRDNAAEEADRAEAAAKRAADSIKEIPGAVEKAKKEIADYVKQKESELKGDTGNVYFASFRVVNGRLKMYSDPTATKIAFRRDKNRLKYRVAIGGNNG